MDRRRGGANARACDSTVPRLARCAGAGAGVCAAAAAIHASATTPTTLLNFHFENRMERLPSLPAMLPARARRGPYWATGRLRNFRCNVRRSIDSARAVAEMFPLFSCNT